MRTPGPWSLHVKAGEQYTPTLTGADHYDKDYIAVVGSDGEVVCDNGQYYARPIIIEDACIIAAAPELLEHLHLARQVLLDVYQNEFSYDEAAMMQNSWFRRITETIAKATNPCTPD